MNALKQAELKFYYELVHSPDGLPSSRVGKNWQIETFKQFGAIEYKRKVAGGIYRADPTLLRNVLKVHFEIVDLEAAVAAMNSAVTKGEIALAAGHTKAVTGNSSMQHIGIRACAAAPIRLTHDSQSLEISPISRVLVQIPTDLVETHSLKAPVGTIAVICENQEDYLTLASETLDLLLHGDAPTLLFWRNDGIQSITQLVSHLGISKLYHYGDFDLCGIQIYESNTLKYAPHARMACPNEGVLEAMIRDHGSRSLFNKQVNRTRGFEPASEDGKRIAQIIRKHRKVIEQETVNQLLQNQLSECPKAHPQT